MKKSSKVISSLFLMVALTLVLTASSFAQSCAKMKPMLVNTNSTWLMNVSGAACGTLANGQQRYFLLNASNQDALLAILLTAVSLDKTVWVNALGDSVAGGDTVNVIALAP